MAEETEITNPPEAPKVTDYTTNLDESSLDVATPTSSRRQSLINIRRQLTNEELSQSGTQKMLLDMLEDSETETERLKGFVNNYYEAVKKAAILSEKLNADRSVEVFFGTGIGLGGAILGLSPYFLDLDKIYGIICIIMGSALIIGASIGRIVKK